MRRELLLLILAVGGCSKGAEADLPSIGEARSLAAEWAMVNQEASRGHLTGHYVETMRSSVREQLQTTQKALTRPKSAYANEIAALIAEPDDAPPGELRAHASRLKQIEDGLESA
jgi:hypothetical protein